MILAGTMYQILGAKKVAKGNKACQEKTQSQGTASTLLINIMAPKEIGKYEEN